MTDQGRVDISVISSPSLIPFDCPDVISSERFISRDNIIIQLTRKLLSSPSIVDEMVMDLDTYSYEMSRAITRTDTAQREYQTYDEMEKQSQIDIHETQQQIDELRVNLTDSRRIRHQYEEYDTIQSVINRYPSRSDTIEKINQLSDQIEQLEQIHSSLDQQQCQRSKDFALFYHSLTSLSSDPISIDDQMQISNQ